MDYLLPLSVEGNFFNESHVSTSMKARWNEERVEIFMLLMQHEMLMRLQYAQEEIDQNHHTMFMSCRTIADRLDLEVSEVVDHMRFLESNEFVKYYGRREIDFFCDLPSVRALGYEAKKLPTFGFIHRQLKSFLGGVPKDIIREEITWLINTNRRYNYSRWVAGDFIILQHPKAV